MRFRAGIQTLALALAVLAACKGRGEQAAPGPDAAVAPSASASSEASPRARAPRFRASGAAGLLLRGVHGLELKEDQVTALEKVSADLRDAAVDAGREPVDSADLGDGIKAGKLDPAKVDSHCAKIEQAARAREARDDDALNRVHRVLTAEQRSQLVTFARAVIAKRELRATHREDAGRPLPFERLLRRLDLTPEQRKKADAIAPKFDHASSADGDAKKNEETLLATFSKDDFDATKVDAGAAKHARSASEDTLKFAGQLLPLLNPPQRERLAKQLASHSQEQSRFGPLRDEED